MRKILTLSILVFIVIACSSQECELSKQKRLKKILPKSSWIDNVQALVDADIIEEMDYSKKEMDEFYQVIIDSACIYFTDTEVNEILECQRKKKVYDDILFNKIIGFSDKASKTGARWAVSNYLNKLGYNYNEGIVAFYKSNYRHAFNYFTTQINEMNDSSYESFLFLGKTLTALEEYSDALKAFNKAIEIDNSGSEAYYNLAYIHLYSIGDKEVAYKMISKALELEPSNIYYNLLLGEIYCTNNNFENGILEFNKILLKDSENVSALNSRALAYDFLGNIEDAYKDYSLAIEIEPLNREALMGLGMLFMKQQNYDSALYYGEKLIYNHPNHVVGYSFLGGYYLKLKKNEQAIPYLTQAIKLGNGFDDLTSRGYAYSEIGEYNKAKGDFETIIKHAEKTYFNTISVAYAYNNLGYVEFKLGNNESALTYIEKSLSLLPENSYAFRNKALVLLETNQITDGCEALHQAKALKFADYYGDEVDNLILEHCK